MAIYQATAIARRLKNSVGEQTFYQRMGQSVVKMKVEENTSNTPLQQRQRLVWKKMQDVESLFDEVAAVGFPSRPVYQTHHNAFMQANGGVVSVNDEQQVTVAYERIFCAKGSLKGPLDMAVAFEAEGRQLVFTHRAAGNGTGKKKDDMLYAAVVEKNLEEIELVELKRRSDSEAAMFSLPESWDAEQLAVYVFVLSENRRKASDSKYLEVKQTQA